MTELTSDFLAVALAARSRGFTWVVPVDDKAVCLKRWLKHNVTKTETELRLMAADFPRHEVGIVLKGHAGSVFVWDIDKPGVLERMRAAGIELPKTYIVQSRPKTAPYKIHVYLRQTDLFATLFPKQVNAGDYDLKGMGGGQVVAEGSIRKDTGEVRTGNGLTGKDICEISDDLARWLKEDSRPLVAAIAAKKREAMRAIKVEGAGIPPSQRTLYLKNQASILFEHGYDRPFILEAITKRCREDCQKGIAWAKSSEGKKKLRNIAYDATFRRKRPNPVYTERHPQNWVSPLTLPEYQHLAPKAPKQDPRQSRAALLIAEVDKMPDSITATRAYEHLGLDSSSRADQQRLARAMTAAGFQFEARGKRRGDRLWVRNC